VTGWLALAAVVAGVAIIVKPFLAPLAWAAVLAVFFYPLFERIRRRIRRPNLSALTAVVLITLVLIVPVLVLTPTVIGQTAAFLGSVTEGDYLQRARALLQQYWERSPIPLGDMEDVIDEVARKSRAMAAQQSARIAGNVASFLLDLAVMLLALFYLLRDGRRVAELLRDISPWGLERHNLMIKETAELVHVTISSSFVTAAVQGAIGGLVFWAVGIPSPLFWGAFMALMALLPLVGPWLVWAPAAVWLLLTGQTGRGIVLIVLGLLIVSGVDNVLRPVLIAGRSQLNGLLVLIGVIGGVRAMGFLGVVLGPLLLATAVGLLRGYHERLAAETAAAQPSPTG